MNIPISRSGTPSSEGRFQYLQSISDPTIQGVFSFSFYIHLSWGHPTEKNVRKNTYLEGLQMYVDAIERKESVFQGWKVVIYTDTYSYDSLKRLEHPFLRNPNVVFCIVEWPYYQPYSHTWQGQVNGDILRCMRLRAFFDFPHIPVFMRDADTIWVNTISDYVKNLLATSDELYEWEANYLRGAARYPNTFIFGTSLGYKRFWHNNQNGKRFAPLGAFAGLQSAMPKVPCFQTQELWETIVSYLTSQSERTGETQRVSMPNETIQNAVVYSNERKPNRVGKDEQLLAFIILPACFENTFFFEFDYFSTRRSVLQGKQYSNMNYPLYIFNRKNNANLRGLFKKAINISFMKNLKENRAALNMKNRTRKEQRNIELQSLFSSLQNDLVTKVKNAPTFQSKKMLPDPDYNPSSIIEPIYNVMAHRRNEQLEEAFQRFRTINNLYNYKRRVFYTAIQYKYGNVNIAKHLETLQELIYTRNKAVREFLDILFTIDPGFRMPGYYENEFNQLMVWYRGTAKGGKRSSHSGKRKTRKAHKL